MVAGGDVPASGPVVGGLGIGVSGVVEAILEVRLVGEIGGQCLGLAVGDVGQPGWVYGGHGGCV